MIYYCPQCGTKVLQGATVCPQCGTQLKFVIQTKGTDNNLGSTAKNPQMKKISGMDFSSIRNDAFGFNSNTIETGPVLKYNEFANNMKGDTVADDDDAMSIIGMDSQFFNDDDIDNQQQDGKLDTDMQNKTVIGTTPANMVKGMPNSFAGDLSKYKIITQVFDKKIGFDAVELEEKLNMYAELGYHLVPNTMICQPGQDFFALMERTLPDNTKSKAAQPQPLNSKKQENKKEEKL